MYLFVDMFWDDLLLLVLCVFLLLSVLYVCKCVELM